MKILTPAQNERAEKIRWKFNIPACITNNRILWYWDELKMGPEKLAKFVEEMREWK